MGAPNVTPYTNQYTFGRGRPLLELLINGVYQGFVPFGNSPACDVNIEGEQFEHENSEGGIGEIDLTVPTKVTRTIELQCDNLSAANIALFLAASVSTLTQASTPVTDEVVSEINLGGIYQLGMSEASPSGARGISGVVVRIKEGDDAAARANNQAYLVGDVYQPATPNDHWYICTVAGTSDASPPTFKLDGTTYTDGTATFKDMGLIVVASTTDVNYRVDTDLALLSINTTGTIATAHAAYAAVVDGGKLSLNVDYTPTANTREQIRTGDTVELRGRFKFLADNPYGENRNLHCADVTITPSGTLPLITGNELGSATFSIGINKLNSVTPAMVIDGTPVDA